MTVGDLKRVLAETMLEDRMEVLVSYSGHTDDGLETEPCEGETLGARCVIAQNGVRRALVIETELIGL